MSPGFVPESILTRLVLRGMNASAAILDEAETYGDTVFVQADAGLSLNRGPLMSTLLWLRCAVEAWPHADLIGKAEDDSWVHLHEVERLLRSALGGMAQMGVAHLYWGTRYETYHWNATAQRPLGFGRPWAVYGDHYLERKVTTHGPNAGSFVGGPKCSPITPDSPFHGPFPYQKGQLYFLDGGLSRRFARDPHMEALGEAALATTDRRLSSLGGRSKEPLYAVWEDVWLGFALSQLRSGSVGMVDMSVTRSSLEAWVNDCTIVWHALWNKNPLALRVVHAWKQSHHQRLPEPCALEVGPQGLTCAGRVWTSAKQCPIKLNCTNLHLLGPSFDTMQANLQQ